MIISKINFAIIWAAALKSDDNDCFVTEWATSSMFDCDLAKSADYVSRLWQVAHMSVRDMRDKTGLSQVKFADLICAPRKTVINWEARGGITNYQRLWLASFLGLLP